jgi:predicted DNA binding CopG/RHH family protein
MTIAKKPQRYLSDTARPDPMAFIEGAGQPEAEQARRKRKEPVIIRFDDDTLKRVDQAAAKRGLSRAALVRMLVIENLPD